MALVWPKKRPEPPSAVIHVQLTIPVSHYNRFLFRYLVNCFTSGWGQVHSTIIKITCICPDEIASCSLPDYFPSLLEIFWMEILSFHTLAVSPVQWSCANSISYFIARVISKTTLNPGLVQCRVQAFESPFPAGYVLVLFFLNDVFPFGFKYVLREST